MENAARMSNAIMKNLIFLLRSRRTGSRPLYADDPIYVPGTFLKITFSMDRLVSVIFFIKKKKTMKSMSVY